MLEYNFFDSEISSNKKIIHFSSRYVFLTEHFISRRSIQSLNGNESQALHLPHEHKLRTFVSLKLYIEYLKFFWTHCFNCRCEQNELLNKSSKYRFINKTTAKVILV